MTKNVNFGLPDDVHARLKAKAALANKQFYEYLIEVLREKAKR